MYAFASVPSQITDMQENLLLNQRVRAVILCLIF